MSAFKDLLDGFELFLSRLWTTGFLLAFLAASALIAPRYGLKLPAIASEWAGGVLLLGLAAVATSTAVLIVKGLRSVGVWTLSFVADKIEMQRNGEAAVENLVTMNETELVALLDVLSSNQRRFEVAAGSPAFILAQKKILRIVDYVGGGMLQSPRSYMVELTPTIAAMSATLRSQLLATVRGNPYRFGGIGHRYITAEDLGATLPVADDVAQS